MLYALIKTANSKAILRWLMIGIAMVSITLVLENALFWYGRAGGAQVFNLVSNSLVIYTLKLSYGLGMWVHFCAAIAAIRNDFSVKRLIVYGFLGWAIIYGTVLYFYEI
jgi:hypothetical protein